MKVYKLEDMINGWFIGNFDPSILKTENFEVSVKYYKKGEYHKSHYHKNSTEITVIVSGSAKMNNIIYNKGDIVEIEPYDATDFEVLEDTSTIVVKIPSSINDKFFI